MPKSINSPSRAHTHTRLHRHQEMHGEYTNQRCANIRSHKHAHGSHKHAHGSHKPGTRAHTQRMYKKQNMKIFENLVNPREQLYKAGKQPMTGVNTVKGLLSSSAWLVSKVGLHTGKKNIYEGVMNARIPKSPALMAACYPPPHFRKWQLPIQFSLGRVTWHSDTESLSYKDADQRTSGPPLQSSLLRCAPPIISRGGSGGFHSAVSVSAVMRSA